MLKVKPEILNPCDNTYEALKLLVNNSIYAQQKYCNNSNKNIKAYLKEFCTIKLCTARQTGHTSAILRLCTEYFDKSLVLYNTIEMARKIREYYNSLYNEDIISGTITNFHSVYRGYEFDAIFIDCASFVCSSKLDCIYDELGPCLNQKEKFVILMQ